MEPITDINEIYPIYSPSYANSIKGTFIENKGLEATIRAGISPKAITYDHLGPVPDLTIKANRRVGRRGISEVEAECRSAWGNEIIGPSNIDQANEKFSQSDQSTLKILLFILSAEARISEDARRRAKELGLTLVTSLAEYRRLIHELFFGSTLYAIYIHTSDIMDLASHIWHSIAERYTAYTMGRDDAQYSARIPSVESVPPLVPSILGDVVSDTPASNMAIDISGRSMGANIPSFLLGPDSFIPMTMAANIEARPV